MLTDELSLEAAYRVRLELRDLPAGLREGLIRYLVHGLWPGHFLEAVLSNNLLEAVQRVDAVHEPFLGECVRFLWLYAPGQAWGTPDRVRTWVEQHARKGSDVDATPTHRRP